MLIAHGVDAFLFTFHERNEYYSEFLVNDERLIKYNEDFELSRCFMFHIQYSMYFVQFVESVI